MTDDELVRLSPAVQAEFRDFLGYSIIALDELGTLEKLITDATVADHMRRLLNAMRDAYLSVGMMDEIVAAAFESLERRSNMRHSEREAYVAGWRAHQAAIAARLSPEDYAVYCRALARRG